MGLLDAILAPVAQLIATYGYGLVLGGGFVAFIVLSVVVNVLQQVLFKNPNEPPMVFHYFPLIGSTITYGMDPYGFFFANTAKYGDVFTFILLGRKTTVYLGSAGNEFILNAKIKDVNAEEIYSPLTTPVFGADVVYDCPNSKLMEQKKFMKINLSTESFQSHVPLITNEVDNFLKKSAAFKGNSGIVDICPALAELTIYTASRSLQGKEVRDKFDGSFADLYHDLDMGFTPINFQFNWLPLPQNRARDHAQRTLTKTYMEIVKARRNGPGRGDGDIDMIWHLMQSTYKDGTAVPDKEIAHMMIALLMAGQHSSSSTSAWIILRLASRPDIQEELFEEQQQVLGANPRALTYEDLPKLPLHQAVIKEVLRIHTPIHSIMRKVKSPMAIAGTPYVVPTSHILLASPGFTSRVGDYFPNPDVWDPHRWDADSAGVKMGQVDEEFEDYGYGNISKGAKSPYLPFGAGRHRCIGEQFANVQLGTITVRLIQNFKFRLPGGAKEVIGTDYNSLFSRPLAPAMVEWERRERA